MVIPGHNLGNSQVSVYRTIGPSLVILFIYFFVCAKQQLFTFLTMKTDTGVFAHVGGIKQMSFIEIITIVTKL